MNDPPGGYVVVIDAGPQFFRKPSWAYGPFPTVAEAQAWVPTAAGRWDATLGGWDWRVVRMGTEGAIRVEAPDAPERKLG